MSAVPKPNVADMRLRRLTENNDRLQTELTRSRIKASEASRSLIQFCQSTHDPMLPSIWGPAEGKMDPYAPRQQPGCECVVM